MKESVGDPVVDVCNWLVSSAPLFERMFSALEMASNRSASVMDTEANIEPGTRKNKETLEKNGIFIPEEAA